jgi:DNA-binding transcriptional LysR family regulator
MLDLDRLATLTAVADEGSITAAARRLNLTQSAVSQQIAALERETGQALFHRRPLRLTEAGHTLVGHARNIVAQMHLAELDIGRYNRMEAGTLRIGAFSSACTGLLPPVLARLRRDHPELALTLTPLDPPAACDALIRGDLDTAICVEYQAAPAPTPEMLTQVPLLREPVHVLVPAAHPAASARQLTIQQLSELPWIEAPNAGLPLTTLASLVGGTALTVTFTYYGDDFRTVLQLVGAGLGSAILPQLAAVDPPPTVAQLSINGSPLQRDVYACLPATRRQPAQVTTFLDVLIDAVRHQAITAADG